MMIPNKVDQFIHKYCYRLEYLYTGLDISNQIEHFHLKFDTPLS